jgi:hypothetical protein
MYNNFFLSFFLPPFENRAVYERMWKEILEPDRPQTTIWHLHIACWIPKGTNTESEYVMLIVFYCNNGCTNASQCYVVLHYLSCMFIRFSCHLELRYSSVKEVH